MADNGIWLQVGRLAAADPAIRAAANAYWCEPKNHLAWAYKVSGYVTHIADPPVAAALIAILENKKGGFSQYWALKALLSGWGRDHPDVKQAIDALICRSDEELYDLISLLPEIIPDKTVARARIIRIAKHAEVRRDLLTIGLEASACDAADHVAVAAILAFSEKLSGPFDPSYTLFRAFGAHADVRALALERARGEDAPLAAIATAYANDPEFAPVLFNAAVPLPVDLRTQIVEVAATGATGTILETALGLAMLETDPELRVRMVIAHHRALLSPAHDAAREALLKKAITAGPDFESIRAAALAGLATIGALDVLAVLEERGKPVALHTGSFIEPIPSVERLVCERFAEFETAFGDSLSERLDSFGRSDQLAKILSVAPSASPAARSAFLALAEHGKIPLTPYTLRALAAERPRSELLLTRCWQMLERVDHANSQAITGAEVGLILREHFAGDAVVRHRLVERYKSTRITKTAIPLAVFAPDAEELPLPVDFDIPGHDFGGWTVAVHVAAYHADAATFCKLLEAMITRRRRSQFDVQHITNLAVEERLQRDPELERLMSARIAKGTDPSVSGSFARYLTAAGKLSPEVRGRALDILHALALNQRLPTAGYDAISDQWRAVRATLLDAVYAGLELS